MRVEHDNRDCTGVGSGTRGSNEAKFCPYIADVVSPSFFYVCLCVEGGFRQRYRTGKIDASLRK